MIVTEFVSLKVNINNIEHLKESGYQDLKLKEIIEVKVKDLSKGSHVKPILVRIFHKLLITISSIMEINFSN